MKENFKVETHLHTKHVSKCGRMDAKEIVDAYKEAGYSLLCVTDHYSRITFDHLGIDLYDPKIDKLGPFLDGFRKVRDEAQKVGITVIRGAEVRFDECDNDYLVFGWFDNLLSDPARVFEMGIVEFARKAREAGALIIQAHPYRKSCTPAIAKYIDGVEIANRNPRHDSRNELAVQYAEEYGLIGTCGSDCHQPEDVALGGIVIHSMPKDAINFARTIKSRHFEIIA